MTKIIPDSELILNPDGSIYHLNLHPADIANDIITVGDPDRVDNVASRLDEIYLTKHKREFKTITGRVGSKDVTILSTGIGTDNIDIVFTELDALVNIDLDSRQKKADHVKINFYRLGTSGALRADVPVGSTLISQYAIGLESLMHFYDYDERTVTAKNLTNKARAAIAKMLPNIYPYTTAASTRLTNVYGGLGKLGVTVTATGFYGPQGRSVLAKPKHTTFLDELAKIEEHESAVTNLEMETAGIYGMAHVLGHEAISFNAIIANRISQKFSSDPKQVVDNMIDEFFNVFTEA